MFGWFPVSGPCDESFCKHSAITFFLHMHLLSDVCTVKIVSRTVACIHISESCLLISRCFLFDEINLVSLVTIDVFIASL